MSRPAGASDEDKAKSQVCDARDDIQTQVNDLSGLTISSSTGDQIKDGLNAIRNDLKEIADAQSDLASDRKEQVQQAIDAFRSEVTQTAQAVVGGLAAGDAKAQVQSALDDLAASSKQAFAPVDCD